MDFQLVRRRLDLIHRKRKWLVLAALFGVSSYGAYKVYHLPSVARRRRKFVKLLRALISIVEMVSNSGETIGVVSKDLKRFLESDSDEIPNSLKQLSKIARSNEFSNSLSSVSVAVTVGILRGYQLENGVERGGGEGAGIYSFPERVMDKLMSTAGTGFVSIVVGSFARNLVLGFYSNFGSQGIYVGSNLSADWVDVLCSEKFRVVIADCVKAFVSTAVAIYLDKTMGVNFYDDLFSGLTNPKHQAKVRDILVSVCNGAVETLIKTSHQVLTKSERSHSIPSFGLADDDSCTHKDKIFEKEISEIDNRIPFDLQNSGWVGSVSSTLAVPSTRKFVLDVTGRVTFETMRSLVEFFLWKASDGLKRSRNLVGEEVLDRGLEVVRYIGAKSSAIITICLALYLYILAGTWAFLPA